MLGGQAVGQLPGAVRRPVVDDEDHEPVGRRGPQDPQRCANHRLEILGLVVGRNHQPWDLRRRHEAPYPIGTGRPRAPVLQPCPHPSPTPRSPPHWPSSATSTSSTGRSSTESSPTEPPPRPSATHR